MVITTCNTLGYQFNSKLHLAALWDNNCIENSESVGRQWEGELHEDKHGDKHGEDKIVC
jgi:hypothetical protein